MNWTWLAKQLLVLLIVVVLCQHATAQVKLRRCMERSGDQKVLQPFKLPTLRLQWDSWETAQMTTAIAGFILSERLGFNVELVSGRSGREVYEAIAKGEIHVSFEAW